jgi:Gluconate 2-dehydrogenase subunit 3
MKRRTVIRNFVFISAGVAVLPYCKEEAGKVSIELKKIKINADQEKLLAAITETIIPTTETPGAKEVSAHVFALTMVDDCADAEGQEKFLKGLQQFEEFTKKKFGKSFIKCSPSEKEQLLGDIQKKEGVSDELSAFLDAIKGLTLQSYMTSEYYMTNVQKFEMAPGRYRGCVPIKKTS